MDFRQITQKLSVSLLFSSPNAIKKNCWSQVDRELERDSKNSRHRTRGEYESLKDV